jgi:hypothetical protein
MGSRRLSGVASTTGGVFVGDLDAGLFRIPTGGGAPARVVATTAAADFLAADLHAYWFESNAIYKASLDATDATPGLVGGGLPHPVSLFNFDTTNLYFVDGQAQVIVRLALAGGAPAPVASPVVVQDLVLRAGFLYFSEGSQKQVYRVSIKDGSTSEALTSGVNVSPRAVEADATTLYWVDDIQILSTPIGKPGMHKALGVGGPGKISGLGLISKMTLLSSRLYWADDAGNVGWTAIDGSACGLVVKAAGEMHGWDVDQDSVYVVVNTGTSAAPASELWRIKR